MSEPMDDRVELRGMAPRRISRQEVIVQVLSRWADEITMEALSIVRVSGLNGDSVDGERKVGGKK